METWDAIRTRRNVRTYRDQPIPPDSLDLILEAGRRSPSASNKQRWDFVLVTERERLERLARVWQGAKHVAQAAAAIALVAPTTTDTETRASVAYDLGQATITMMLMATDLGVATAHARVEDQEMAAEILGLPEGHRCAWLIALGLPEDQLAPIERPDRRAFEDVVHRETW